MNIFVILSGFEKTNLALLGTMHVDIKYILSLPLKCIRSIQRGGEMQRRSLTATQLLGTREPENAFFIHDYSDFCQKISRKLV